MISWLVVIVGGMVGAAARYLVTQWFSARNLVGFPWGTFTANVLGCLILGAATGVANTGAPPSSTQLLVGTGMCGALTTYSTFSYETLRLAESGHRRLSAVSSFASLAVGVCALCLGVLLAEITRA